MEGHVEKRYLLYGRNRQVFLDGLQRYQDRGVLIFIDRKKADPEDWIRILEVQPDGSFYMGDYVMEEGTAKGDDMRQSEILCEDSETYETQKKYKVLKEIRFDRVYHR